MSTEDETEVVWAMTLLGDAFLGLRIERLVQSANYDKLSGVVMPRAAR